MIHFRRILLLCSILLLAGVAKAGYTYHFKPIHEGFDAIAQRLNHADFANERQTSSTALRRRSPTSSCR